MGGQRVAALEGESCRGDDDVAENGNPDEQTAGHSWIRLFVKSLSKKSSN
jgi:hypothetical protein